ncbi:MAG: hypothetical protein C0454_12650 [Parvibaculum sp.]|jgi:hypothetical protein|nr:hypothetical protein [Parvibaculum sp.]
MQSGTEFLEFAFSAIIATSLPVWAIGVIAILLLHRQLKNRHPAIWTEVGGSIFNQSLGKEIRFWKFLFSSQHTFMEDARLSRLVVLVRIFWICFAFLFLAGCLVIALMQIGVSHVVKVEPARMGGDGDTPLSVSNKVSYLFDIALGLTLIHLATAHFFMRYMRRNHRETWEALGSPSLFLNNTPMNNIRTTKFLLTRRHRTLDDSRLSLYVYVIRLQWASVLCLVLVLAVSAFSSGE